MASRKIEINERRLTFLKSVVEVSISSSVPDLLKLNRVLHMGLLYL